MRANRATLRNLSPLLILWLSTLLLLTTACSRSKVIDSYPEEYVGIGVELTIDNGEPVITRILPDSPAQQSGLEVGDRILTIDERPTASMGFGEVVMHIRGKPGSQLSLKALRGTQTIWVVLPRGSLKKHGTESEAGQPAP